MFIEVDHEVIHVEKNVVEVDQDHPVFLFFFSKKKDWKVVLFSLDRRSRSPRSHRRRSPKPSKK